MSEQIYERLLGLTRRLGAPVGVDELLAEIAAAGAALLDADRVSVFVHEPASDGGPGELWARLADGEPALRVPADRGLVGEALRTGRPVVVPDTSVDPRFNPEVDRATGYRTRTLLTVPMVGLGSEEGRGGDRPGVAGVMQFLNKRGGAFGEGDAKWAEVLAAQAAVVLERALMEAERSAKRAMEREMAVAREVQEASWPTRLPAVAGYDLAGWAEAASAAGGDTYDAVVAEDGALWVLVADATGHGVGPALASAQVRSMFRMAVHAGLSVDDAMRHTHRQVILDMPPGRFVTAFLGRIDPVSHELTYASAGHGPVFLVKADRLVELETTGLPLGIDFGMDPDPACRASLGVGEGLALFSDGLFEALDPGGATLGIDPVKAALSESAGSDAAGVLARLRERLDGHAAGRGWEDDVTVLVVKRRGGG